MVKKETLALIKRFHANYPTIETFTPTDSQLRSLEQGIVPPDQDGVDLWVLKAAEHYRVKIEDVTPEQRRIAKMMFWGEAYTTKGGLS